ncbi:hypothetical protein B0H21DRAFT_821364 [Amylocystis lapponica]|nr:hypothetical protein B0H21DRAFT_821364 [Amylocystis lapponica]
MCSSTVAAAAVAKVAPTFVSALPANIVRSPKGGFLYNIGTAHNLANDGVNAYSAVHQAEHSRRERRIFVTATWVNIVDDGLKAVGNGTNAYNAVHQASNSRCERGWSSRRKGHHSREDVRREPSWVSIVDDGFKAVGDGANPYHAVQQANSHRSPNIVDNGLTVVGNGANTYGSVNQAAHSCRYVIVAA